jgi:hypothetical protein
MQGVGWRRAALFGRRAWLRWALDGGAKEQSRRRRPNATLIVAAMGLRRASTAGSAQMAADRLGPGPLNGFAPARLLRQSIYAPINRADKTNPPPFASAPSGL